MVKFNAGTLSSPSANLSKLSVLSVIKEYWRFNKLCKFAVSNVKEKCFTAIGNSKSVKITLVQCDSFFILSQYSISEIIDYSNSLK